VTVVVTGASGQLGRRVVEHLLERDVNVVAVTRRPEALAGVDVEVRAGDFDAPDSLAAAFAGGEKLLLISTDAVGRRVPGHMAAIDAAVAAGVRSIAYTSMVNPSDSNPTGVAPDHRATEDAVRASGLEWTFLRHAIYADVLAGPVQGAIASGRLVSNAGAGRCAYVAREDCAAVAAAMLTGGDHAGRAYDVTGPAGLTVEDIAAIAAELGGREVEVVKLDDDAWVATMVKAGLDEGVARFAATFGIATRTGYAAPVSAVVQELAGRAPTPARDVLAAALT
jgi:NAD(P)H dehydrogenase (quinone)